MRQTTKCELELKEHLARTGLSQGQIAELFSVTQPRVSDLMRGKIVFALDALVNMAGGWSSRQTKRSKSGLDPPVARIGRTRNALPGECGDS